MPPGNTTEIPGESFSGSRPRKRTTNFQRLQKSLHRREKLFRLIFEKAGIGIILADNQGRFLEVNPAMAAMLGYTPDQMRHMHFEQIAHPDDIKANQCLFEELVAGKRESYRLTKRYLHRDGRVIWGDLIASCETNHDDLPLLCIGMVEDVTEQKKALAALQESETRYRLLAENISDVIWTSDLIGRATYISPSVQSRTGYAPEELQDRTLGRLLKPDSAKRFRQKIAEQLELEKVEPGDPSRSFALEVEYVRKDGSTGWAENLMTFLRDPQGAPIGILGVSRDIGERKLLEKQLFQAQKMEAVAQLAGGIAHDFNNFLMIIQGYCDLLKENIPENDALQRYTQEIMLAVERTTSMTRQLLAFSRRQVMQPQLIKLNDLITEMERMLRRLIAENIALDIALEPALGNIEADPGQIEQVIMNLVLNARDALAQGGEIQIRTERAYLDKAYAQEHPGVNPGFYIKLTVADTGIGMDAETLAHIFEPFFSTKGGEQGTGLGLATVYGIVKQSGGFVEVSSQPGQGTVFSLYFPRVQRAIMRPEIATCLKGLQGNETILLAEDEKILREVICRSLQSYGFKVLEAADGREALEIAEDYQEPIHLLLTDVVMPHLGGAELAARLTELRPEIKVLYMSGHLESALTRHGLLEKTAPFIQKPCRAITLVRKVREVLHPATAA